MQLNFDFDGSEVESRLTIGFNTVAGLLKCWPQELIDCIDDSPYRRVVVAKPKGRGRRVLNIPNKDMMEIAKLAKRRVFYGIRARKGTWQTKMYSPRVLVDIHRRGRAFFMIDLKDAYASVSRRMLVKAVAEAYRVQFTRMLDPHYYRQDPLFIQATRSGTINWDRMYPIRDLGIEEELAEAVADLFWTQRDGLPQGSPVSPLLFELVCRTLEGAIRDVLFDGTFRTPIRWCRYSDNLIVSTREGSIPAETRSAIIQAVKDCGFVVNRKKVHYRTGASRRPRMLGLSLTEPQNYQRRLALSRDQIRSYRGLIHRAVVDSSVSEDKVRGVLCWVASVYGREPSKIPQRLRKPIADFMVARGLRVLKIGFDLKPEDMRAG
jgi:hypothetical protein